MTSEKEKAKTFSATSESQKQFILFSSCYEVTKSLQKQCACDERLIILSVNASVLKLLF